MAASSRADTAVDDPVPLALLEAVLTAVSDAIHDRPVQQLVAAQLLIETGLRDHAGASSEGPGAATNPMVDRGLVALTSAAQQSRRIMWALTPPEVRPAHLVEDLTTFLTLANPEDEPPSVTVAVDDPASSTAVRAVVAALHHTIADAVLAGHHLAAVVVAEDAEGVEARATSTGPRRQPGAWLDLARHRLAAVEGTLAVVDSDDSRVMTVRVPERS